MKNKFLALLIVSSVLVMAFSMSFALSKFPDTIGTKYDSAVEKLSSTNVISGFPDGTFKPGEPVTRAQLAKMLVEEHKLKNVTNVPLTKFSDLTSSHWGYSWIKTAVDNELIVGYPDGTFKPDNTVTYAECMAMLLRAMKLEAKMTDKTWPTGYMNEAAKQGYLNNVTYSSPNDPGNRGEIAISIYNVEMKLEKARQEEELARLEAEKKAKEEAEKNALEFDIVSTTDSSKDTYTLKFDGSKTKYDIYSISGKTKLTDSKVEALEKSVIGYQDGKNGLEIAVSYTGSSFDKALVINKVETDTITYKDKTTLEISKDTIKNKYKYYTFIRINADVDDEEIVFDKVTKLGLGLESAKFVKGERVLIDDTNKVFIFLKGIDASAKISKGKVSDDEEDTSDYIYGWVTNTSTKSKTDYVKIGKTTYEVYSKSSDFAEDTYVVAEIKDEGDDYDIVTLVKAFSVSSLDTGAKIVTSVSGTKKGSQKVYLDSSSTATDYYTTANVKKYKDYHVVVVDVAVNSSKNLIVDDYDIKDGLDEVLFTKGDRLVIDTSKEVFMVYTGLAAGDVVKSGKWTSAADAEANKTFTVSYAWSSSTGACAGATLPSKETIKNGTTYTAKLPTLSGYTFKADKTSFKVTANTTINISWTKNEPQGPTELEVAQAEYNSAVAAKQAADEELADARTALQEATTALTEAQNDEDEKKQLAEDADAVYQEAHDDYVKAVSALNLAKQEYEHAESGDTAAYEAYIKAKEDEEKAKEDEERALRLKTKAESDYEAAKAATTKASTAKTKAEEAVTKAEAKVKEKEQEVKDAKARLDALQGNNS